MSMEFLMPETKVYAILTAGYDGKERMEGRILGGRNMKEKKYVSIKVTIIRIVIFAGVLFSILFGVFMGQPQ